ncbi:HK97 family phage prohead protease [Methylobacterium sp. BTF04]|uniref:HK97 family phage prohead protease n=1 Tax=Methylobacterium sp. BTF04 TaxID=2708300 RepID=UPI0013D1EEF2|nr:HK97 family phage prohead protease [Methylobacterium sp. BTF04]NEU14056.1 HK97 family phage prohead protease [Methylobacterium sp. BTF04]
MDGHFTGYASLFGVPDLGRDVVAAGAFAASLAQRGAEGVRMLWQHDPAEPVGRWLSLTEDARGLRVAGQLNLAVQRARELDALMREGALDGLSIGFRTLRSAPERGGLRRLHSVDLWEISLVTFPLQSGARIATKSAPLAAELRAFARRVAPSRRPPVSASTRPVAAPSPRTSRFA